MPELPEVETIIREIRPLIVDKKIVRIDLFWPGTLVNPDLLDPVGQVIHKVSRQGKYIILSLQKMNILIHLRMTGRLTFAENGGGKQFDKHLRLRINFEGDTYMDFIDARKFGRVYLSSHPQTVLKNVGVDALDPKLTPQILHKWLKKGKRSIKSFLLDQRFMAGIGNIYADESLFQARIHPSRPCNELKMEDCERLLSSTRRVLNQAIVNMGSTISDYRDVRGNPGRNQHYFKVYGRVGNRCLRCDTVIEKIRIAGRSSYFCPECQR